MKMFLVIGVGSFIGGICRYLLSLFVQTKFTTGFPFGTFTVNIIGCFLIGLIFALSEKGQISQEWKLFLATGLIGGFTTFSAFSIETINLLREGQFLYASSYLLGSFLIGLLATFIGFSTIKLF